MVTRTISVMFSLFFFVIAFSTAETAAAAPGSQAVAVGESTSGKDGVQVAEQAVPGFSDLVDKAFSKEAGEPHFVQILNIGDEALLARIHLIRKARESIYIQTFIWADDASGSYLFRELLLAARRGVKVKLLVDQPWSDLDTWNAAYAAVADPNLEIKFYNPIFGQAQTSSLEMLGASVTSFKTLNRRMHNKLFVVDDTVAITGGRNIEDKYFDRDPRYTFKDRDLLIIGKVVKDMTRSFRSYWDFELSVPIVELRDIRVKVEKIASTRLIDEFVDAPINPLFKQIELDVTDAEKIAEYFTRRMRSVDGKVIFYGDVPGKEEADAEKHVPTTGTGIAAIMEAAGKSLVIQTPYLIFRDEALDLMKQVRRKHPGFHAVAVTNSLASTDNIVVYALAMKQRKRLVKTLGFEVYEFMPLPGDVTEMIPRYAALSEHVDEPGEAPPGNDLPVDIPGTRIGLHAKSFVVDDRVSWIGSHNFDPRSADFNTELAVAIWDEKFAAELKRNILTDAEPQNSWVVAPRKKIPVLSYLSGLLESISRRLPVLDVWPFHYTTNYALREGQAPIPHTDLRFYERYRSVGYFPGINLSPKAVQTRLISAMGGFATPLM